MDSEFSKLKKEYSLPSTSIRRKEEIVEEMRINVKNRNGGKDVIDDSPYLLNGEIIIISSATREELYNADNILGTSGL